MKRTHPRSRGRSWLASILAPTALVALLAGSSWTFAAPSSSAGAARPSRSGPLSDGELSALFSEQWQGQVGSLGSDAVVAMLPDAPRQAPLRQEMFASPLIPLIYERLLPPVWAAGLRVGGMDEEFREAARFLEGDGTGIIADVSCGTGFIARRLASSGLFRHVLALDFSAEMLQEFQASMKRGAEPGVKVPEGRLSIVRGDAGALPFATSSLDAVHWGAAMHCVPDAAKALREVHRVLKPQGKLYATTFLRPLPDVVFRFFELSEIEDMASAAGFIPYRRVPFTERRGVYGILRAVK